MTERNGRKTLTTVQGLPKKFDQKKILKVIKKKFGIFLGTLISAYVLICAACNGTIVNDTEMGEVIQLQGDQRKDVQEFLIDKEGLELDAKTIKVRLSSFTPTSLTVLGPRVLSGVFPTPFPCLRSIAILGARMRHWLLFSHQSWLELVTRRFYTCLPLRF